MLSMDTFRGWSFGSRKCLGVTGHEMWHRIVTAHLLNMHKLHFLKYQVIFYWK